MPTVKGGYEGLGGGHPQTESPGSLHAGVRVSLRKAKSAAVCSHRGRVTEEDVKGAETTSRDTSSRRKVASGRWQWRRDSKGRKPGRSDGKRTAGGGAGQAQGDAQYHPLTAPRPGASRRPKCTAIPLRGLQPLQTEGAQRSKFKAVHHIPAKPQS